MRKSRSFLKSEAGVYQLLQGKTGIPQLYWIGTEDHYHIIAIDLLGYSLQEVYTLTSEKIPVIVTLAIADQMVIKC